MKEFKYYMKEAIMFDNPNYPAVSKAVDDGVIVRESSNSMTNVIFGKMDKNTGKLFQEHTFNSGEYYYVLIADPSQKQLNKPDYNFDKENMRIVIYNNRIYAGNQYMIHDYIITFIGFENPLPRSVTGVKYENYENNVNLFSCWQLQDDKFYLSESYGEIASYLTHKTNGTLQKYRKNYHLSGWKKLFDNINNFERQLKKSIAGVGGVLGKKEFVFQKYSRYGWDDDE